MENKEYRLKEKYQNYKKNDYKKPVTIFSQNHFHYDNW